MASNLASLHSPYLIFTFFTIFAQVFKIRYSLHVAVNVCTSQFCSQTYLSVCLSVMLCIVAKRYIPQQVSEQVNRKLPLGTQYHNFQPSTLTQSGRSHQIPTHKIWKFYLFIMYHSLYHLTNLIHTYMKRICKAQKNKKSLSAAA